MRMRTTRHNTAGRYSASLPFGVGLAVSLVLHIGVLLPWLYTVMTTRSQHITLREARLSPEDPRDRQSAHEDDITLGIEDSEASTLTWIGYDEYREHMARQSTIEQAQQTFEAGAEPASPFAPAAIDAPPTDVLADAGADAAEPSSDAVQAAEGSGAADAAPLEVAVDTQAAVEALRASMGRIEQWRDVVDDAMVALLTAAVRRDVAPDAPDDSTSDARDEATASGASPARDEGDAETRTAQNTEQDESAGGGNPQSRYATVDQPGDPGTPADREADATSVIAVTSEKWGQPLAAEGMTIETHRPRFNSLERRAVLRANPVYAIDFDHMGRPLDVTVQVQAGHRGVDEAVLTSIYKWRATGRAIDALSESDTVRITIQIVLRRP